LIDPEIGRNVPAADPSMLNGVIPIETNRPEAVFTKAQGHVQQIGIRLWRVQQMFFWEKLG
jgi:hypothetical protein